MGLFGINIDLKEIINERLINTTVLSVVVGISYYMFLNNDVLFAILVGLVTFLLSALVLFLFARYKITQQEQQKSQYAINRRKSELQYHREEIETFFMTLDENLLKIATIIYEIPHIDGAQRYERYIAFEKIAPALHYLNKFAFHSTPCIWNDESMVERSGTSMRRIVFDPMFHDLINHYLNTGEKRFPNTLNIMDYSAEYPKNMYM